VNKSKISSVLKQGDCLEILKKLPDSSVDLVITDPPYEFAAHGGWWSIWFKTKRVS